jgi:hypothetical protein
MYWDEPKGLWRLYAKRESSAMAWLRRMANGDLLRAVHGETIAILYLRRRL